MENTAVDVIPKNHEVVNFEQYAMSTDSVVRQVNLVQDIMKKVMKSGEHYGIIPGCEKPSLYKPGAEKLGFTFRLAPEYDVTTIDWPNGHREYQVKCRLRHIPTGMIVGEGVASCTTLEGKYRYRGGEKIPTDQPVPKEYWNLKNAGKMAEAKQLIGGDGWGVGKDDDRWVICEVGEKAEHDNPADYYNTCEKMAKKRAHVDAILTATAASDIFTQDIEDMPEVIPGAKEAAAKQDKKQSEKPPVKPPQAKASAVKDTLKQELKAYCPDESLWPALLKELTYFKSTKNDEEFFIESITHEKFSDKWAQSTLSKLREKAKAAKYPDDCTKQPSTCNHSKFGDDGGIYCQDKFNCEFMEK